jgi:hypothetical protein
MDGVGVKSDGWKNQPHFNASIKDTSQHPLIKINKNHMSRA